MTESGVTDHGASWHLFDLVVRSRLGRVDSGALTTDVGCGETVNGATHHVRPEGDDGGVTRLNDQLGRELGDLRISLTDRCNLRCRYCMPRERFGPGHRFLPREALLSPDEIERVARVFVGLGVRKLRLTGGEPLLRRDLIEIVRRLSRLGVDLALTANGLRLAGMARGLAEAGLQRVTVSLDSLHEPSFRAMTDSRRDATQVLAGIDAAAEAGLRPVKINVVIRRNVNEDRFLEIAEHFRGTGHIPRFIEYMDVGHTNTWSLNEVIAGRDIVAALDARFGVDALDATDPGEVAQRYGYRDGAGEFGVIASVSQPFCHDCVRARLSCDGQLFGCLFATAGSDLRAPLRAGATDGELAQHIGAWWQSRADRYSQLRGQRQARSPERIEMSYIGG